MVIVVENTTLQIAYILVTRPKIRRPRRSAHIAGVVLDAMVDEAVDAVADSKLIAISGATIIGMGIEIITEISREGQCLDVLLTS